YKLTHADVGNTIALLVTAGNSAGTSSAVSAPTAVIAAAPPSDQTAPTISGTAQIGQTLTAASGNWNGTPPLSYAYQWLRCDSTGANCNQISGATSNTYAVTTSDVGATVRVAVTASNSLGSSVANSADSGVVISAASDIVVAAAG